VGAAVHTPSYRAQHRDRRRADRTARPAGMLTYLGVRLSTAVSWYQGMGEDSSHSARSTRADSRGPGRHQRLLGSLVIGGESLHELVEVHTPMISGPGLPDRPG
jgi:hypothetical protein